MRHRAALACATALCIWPAWTTAQLVGDRTECAVRAEGDITAEANVNCGYQPEEVLALIAEATAPLKELNAAQMDEIVRLAGEARSAGLSVERVVVLARRIAKDVPDIDTAFAELERAVDVAIEVQARGKAGLDGDQFVDAVLARMAELSAKGLEDEAAAEVDRALAELEAQAKRQKLALLDAGLRADILRRNPVSAAQRVAEKVELDTPDPTRLFAALRAEQDVWYMRGRDGGLNFDLEISIELARIALAHARDADERGAALNLNPAVGA